MMRLPKAGPIAAAMLATGLVLTGCSSSSENGPPSGETITVSTNAGEVEVPKNPTRVVALDNTSIETLKAFGVTPVAIPKSLYAKDVFADWIADDDIKDVGSHNEPKLDVVEDVEPDLILGGYRFGKYTDDLQTIAAESNGAFIDIAASDDAPDGRQAALISQTETLGRIFGQEDRATEIIEDYQAKRERARAAATGESVFLANVNGGKIDNGAKRMQPLVAPLEMTDVFAGEAGDVHHNSGLSPEAIAAANPSWVIVMDRDAAVEPKDGQTPQTAAQVFAAQEAFAGTTFADRGQIVYLDPFYYLREGIQGYGDSYATIATTMEAKR